MDRRQIYRTVEKTDYFLLKKGPPPKKNDANSNTMLITNICKFSLFLNLCKFNKYV